MKEREKLRQIYKFPKFTDLRNIDLAERMEKNESVALHVRRSDHMYDNGQLFERGYFGRAVNYMKENVSEPVFYIFSDEPDWCKSNLELLGLSTKDEITIIDWNTEKQSFRDMQLMTYCKHNILAISSFSWWGYYLSNYSKKVVCAPNGYWLEVSVHF